MSPVSARPRTAAALLFLCSASALADAPDLSLTELLAAAEAHAPAARLARQRLGYGAAAAEGAAPLLRQSPTLEFGIGPRFDGAGERDFDFVASLAQPLEVAGERGLRRAAAERLGAQLEADATAVRWQVRREVTLAWSAAVAARLEVDATERLSAFAEELVRIARRRFQAGDIGSVEVTVAETDFAQARQARLSAQRALRLSRLRLAELTGASLELPPSVAADFGALHPPPALEPLLDRAPAEHPEVRSREAAVLEAKARRELADREAWPVPTLGVQVAREGSAGSPANYIVLGQVGLPLPVWQQNRGERAKTRVDEAVAQTEQSLAVRAWRLRVLRAHAELATASERLTLLTIEVTPSLGAGLALLKKGFEAGELPLLNVTAFRERFLQAQRTTIDAWADYHRARAELEFALGAELPSTPHAGVTP